MLIVGRTTRIVVGSRNGWFPDTRVGAISDYLPSYPTWGTSDVDDEPEAPAAPAASPSATVLQVAAETVAGALPFKPEFRATLTTDQKVAAGVIFSRFAERKLPRNAGLAAIVNAYRESSLGKNAIGDNGHSVGLFQLNDRGAGKGMTTEARLDPRTNTETILNREVMADSGATFREAAAMNGSVADLAAIFTRDVERPADIPKEQARSRELAETMFVLVPPHLTAAEDAKLAKMSDRPTGMPTWLLVSLGLVFGFGLYTVASDDMSKRGW
jgi:hypothetical protein